MGPLPRPILPPRRNVVLGTPTPLTDYVPLTPANRLVRSHCRVVRRYARYGMRGKIRDAIGTHGHMKCLFNGVITQRDTICATMYKRIFPKFLLA